MTPTNMTAGKIFAVLVMGIACARLVGRAMAQPPQDSCTYSSECGDGMCKVWENRRFVCEPKQYAVAVWDHDCIDKVELTKDSHVEAPLVDGEPDRKHSKLSQAKVRFKEGCTFHYEVRTR